MITHNDHTDRREDKVILLGEKSRILGSSEQYSFCYITPSEEYSGMMSVSEDGQIVPDETTHFPFRNSLISEEQLSGTSPGDVVESQMEDGCGRDGREKEEQKGRGSGCNRKG